MPVRGYSATRQIREFEDDGNLPIIATIVVATPNQKHDA